MPLILSANVSGIMKWWVYASFAVHPNMCGHSGGGLFLGQGFPIVSSTKQKLNTQSSTETKIVVTDDFMPAIYGVKDNVLFQDSKSYILLDKNGKASSRKRTKHINIWYFFITEEVSVAWCPTGDLIGYYATKPLQGALFRKFRDQIMGVTPTRDSGPGKTDGGVGRTETNKSKPKKGKVICVVPPGKEAAPQECVGSPTRDSAKAGPGIVKKIADLTIFNQSKGNSGSYAHAARVGMQNHSKCKSLLHLTS
jgi:hypothetical protein